jgi:TfoX/Sxy family transcriptional regulator of competence genes
MDKTITAQRIADQLLLRGVVFEQKKMFGGICFLVNDKMLVGANRDGKLMVRVDPVEDAVLSQRAEVEPMVHGGRSMPGFLYIEPDGFEEDTELEFWLEKCLEFNPRAKSSKKK